MSHLLITNDDGIDSPALAPLARALSSLDTVEVTVPDRERSWISKAITRHDEVRVEKVERGGIAMWTTTGYPADCTQLGIHSLFDGPPRLVVSGINVGFNFGAAYMLSSGTVGAAAEAWINGVPAIAISAGTNGDWPTWARWVLTPDASPMWERMAAIASEIVATFLEHGFPEGADVVNVNLPETADVGTPRRVVDVARVGYDRLFGAKREGVYAHEFGGGFVHFAGLEGTDVETARNGEVAITPIRLQHTGSLPDALRAALER
jgi:5'-nucleotidase